MGYGFKRGRVFYNYMNRCYFREFGHLSTRDQNRRIAAGCQIAQHGSPDPRARAQPCIWGELLVRRFRECHRCAAGIYRE